MQIERGLMDVVALGPGKRFAFWVNGCSRRCKGCVSPELQAPREENEQDVVDFLSRFNLTDVDGVTISGGEPFDQLSELERGVSYLYGLGIRDILVYTGYQMEELEVRQDERIRSILSKIAVLVDGPYIDELNLDANNLKGSVNQRIHYCNPDFRGIYKAYQKERRTLQTFCGRLYAQ